MLTTHHLNEQLSFSPQISSTNLKEIASLGYKQIICNRPNNEDFQQPEFQSIQTEAQKYQIDCVYAPVIDGQFTSEILALSEASLNNGKKTLMYCLSGTRSTVVYAIIQARQGKHIEDIMTEVANAGYDLSHFMGFIDAHRAQY